MTVWEYDIRPVRFGVWDQTKDELNQLGVDGWELVKFSGEIDDEGMTTAFFKRPLDSLDV